MPNYIEIGEAGLAIARRALPGLAEDLGAVTGRQATSLLERSGYLTENIGTAITKMMNGTARNELPTIERALSNATSKGTNEFVVYGRPASEAIIGPGGSLKSQRIVVYEPHRNISVYPNGEISIATPTPSGQQLLLQRFNLKGPYAEVNMRPQYAPSLKDSYPLIPSERPGIQCMQM